MTGHSAGGHLAAMLLATDWPAFGEGLPPDLVKGACAMSGVFDLEALVRAATGPNDDLKMDLAEANANAPIRHLPEPGQEPNWAPALIVACGEPELDEFKRQSASFAAAWRGAGRFEPRMSKAERDQRYAGWRDAVGRVRSER